MPRRDVADDMQRKSKWPTDVAEDDPVLGIPKLRRKERHAIIVLGIPKLRRKERHAIKGNPQSAPRRKGEYSVGAVQGKAVTSTLNAPTNVLAALVGKGPLNSVATKNKVKATITAIKYSTPDRAMFFSFYNHPQPLWV